MANRFCVSLTHAKDNQDKATVGFVVANAAVGSGKETLVFLSVEGVRLQEAQARREQPGGRRRDRRRREARGVPVRGQSLRQLLSDGAR